MIKVSDYIVKRLIGYGVKHVFMVTGGGAMHLNDSFGRNRNIKIICNHHEQACAIAAEGYARVSGHLGVVNVTSGPGGLNTLTGVMAQWTDSVPVLYISGQVKRETTVGSYPNIALRQIGDQEVDIIPIVKPITKFAVSIRDPLDIKYIIEKAVYMATHGRPGPVWIDVPLDIQSAVVNANRLRGYKEKGYFLKKEKRLLKAKISAVWEQLARSKRPVFIAGYGIRISGAQKKFLSLVEKLKIPVLSSFNGCDLMATNHPQFIGRIGTIGSRAGNFALQNSDLVLAVGTRNNIRQISYNWKNFARKAKIIVVDIDDAELKKPTVRVSIPICADAKEFITLLSARIKVKKIPDWNWWLNWCLKRKEMYPTILKEQMKLTSFVNPYYFARVLSEVLPRNAVVITGNATPSIAYFQSAIVKKGQRVIWNSGCAAMGYDLPAALGACLGRKRQKVVCLAGEGSLQMNIQELQTLAHHNLPIKLFVLNNGGYVSIKQTQDIFFAGRRTGVDKNTGVSFPVLWKIAKAYGLNFKLISDHRRIREKIRGILNTKGPIMCEVRLPHEYQFMPKLSSEKKKDGRVISKPLEDMFPFLNRKEFYSNMIIPPLTEDLN